MIGSACMSTVSPIVMLPAPALRMTLAFSAVTFAAPVTGPTMPKPLFAANTLPVPIQCAVMLPPTPKVLPLGTVVVAVVVVPTISEMVPAGLVAVVLVTLVLRLPPVFTVNAAFELSAWINMLPPLAVIALSI